MRFRLCDRRQRERREQALYRLVQDSRVGELRGKTLDSYVPRTGQQRVALQAAQTATVDNRVGLILYGPPGAGKTHLAVGIANACVAAGVATMFCRVAELLDDLRGLEREGSGSAQALRTLATVTTLVLDDFGAERLTPFGAERLCEILDRRLNAERQTIVTTNLNREGLREHLGGVAGARIVSRLSGCGAWVLVMGPDARERGGAE